MQSKNANITDPSQKILLTKPEYTAHEHKFLKTDMATLF